MKRLVAGAAFALVCIAVPVAVVEIVGQNLFLQSWRSFFFRDVDHRFAPYAHPGINGDGLRSTREASDFRESDINVIFLGDSYVYGYSLDAHQTVPHQVEAMARRAHPNRRIHVANFGWISASPLLSLRQLRDIGARYKPDTVVLGLDMTDFYDDLTYERLIDRPGIFGALAIAPVTFWMGRRIVASSASLDWLHTRIYGYPSGRYFAMNQPLSRSRAWLRTTRKNLEAIDEFTREELGARFVVFVFPRSFQYSTREAPESWERNETENLGPYVLEPFAYFEEIQDDLAFPVISILPAFQNPDVFPTCFIEDPHWNANGARVAARAITARCIEARCFDDRQWSAAPAR